MRPLLPSGGDVTYAELAELYAWPDRPWTRLNFVASVDGSTQGGDGRSASLGSAADQVVFHLLRSTCDVVLVGAGTARAEGYRPVQAHEVDQPLRRRLGLAPVPALAVVSGSLDLPPDLVQGGDAATVVLTTAAAPADRRADLAQQVDVLVVGERCVEPALAVAALHERGLVRVLAEGGPGLARDLAAAAALDELCLTLRATLVAGQGLRLMAGPPLDPPPALGPPAVLAEGPDLFLRYPVLRSRT